MRILFLACVLIVFGGVPVGTAQIMNPSTTIELLRVDAAQNASELEAHATALARNSLGTVVFDSDDVWPPLQDNWSTAAPLSAFAAALGPEALSVVDASCDITHPFSTLNVSGGFNTSLFASGFAYAPTPADYAEAVSLATASVAASFQVVVNPEFPPEVLIANAKYVVFDIGEIDCLNVSTHNATAGPTSFTSVYLGNGIFQSTAVVANLSGPPTTTIHETHFGGIDAQYQSFWEVFEGELISVSDTSSYNARCDAGNIGGNTGVGVGGGAPGGAGPQSSTITWWNSIDVDVIVYDDWEDVGMIDP